MFAAADVYEGLNTIEHTMNNGLVIVTLVVWGFFLWRLRQPESKPYWFMATMFLHLAPTPIMLIETNQRVALQFFRYGLLGWLAVIIGLPHYLYEPGKRNRPRAALMLAVVLVNVVICNWILSHSR